MSGLNVRIEVSPELSQIITHRLQRLEANLELVPAVWLALTRLRLQGHSSVRLGEVTRMVRTEPGCEALEFDRVEMGLRALRALACATYDFEKELWSLA